jgi:hypothetical protein
MTAALTLVQVISPTRFTRHSPTGTSSISTTRIDDNRQCQLEDSPTFKMRYG